MSGPSRWRGRRRRPAVQMIADEGEAAKVLAALARAVGSGARRPAPATSTRWSATQNVVWKTPLTGQRQLVADRLGRSHLPDDGATTARRPSLLAFDRADGRRLWERSCRRAIRPDAHDKNGHASATAATDGQRIYASFGTRGLIAVDMNGKQVWHVELGRDRRTTTARRARRCSTRTASSSTRTSAAARSSRRSTPATGKQVWRTPRDAHGRVGHADRRPRRRSRRDHRQRPEPVSSPTTPTPGASCGAAAAPPSR